MYTHADALICDTLRWTSCSINDLIDVPMCNYPRCLIGRVVIIIIIVIFQARCGYSEMCGKITVV